jgi:hypothetical protein
MELHELLIFFCTNQTTKKYFQDHFQCHNQTQEDK